MTVRYYLPLDEEQFTQLMRPANGSGGYQTLLRKLQRQVAHTLALEARDIARIARYAALGGGIGGGFQDRLIKLIKADDPD